MLIIAACIVCFVSGLLLGGAVMLLAAAALLNDEDLRRTDAPGAHSEPAELRGAS